LKLLFTNLSNDQANLCLLILTASDIKAKAEKNRDGWKIHVAETDCDQALEIVKQYFRENPLSDPASIVSSAENPPSFLGLGAALVLLAFYVAAEVNAVHSVLIAEFGCSAEDVLRGQWYRTLTALMLHKDIVHLAGNMAAITVFTSAVTAATGSGIGSFMILLSGMAGNLLNAFFYKSNHFSIGASTAVFGAIGILSALGFGRKIRRPGRRINAWLPLFSGLCLLAFLGGPGERVDLMAHLFGFAAGIVIGLLYVFFCRQPTAPAFQTACLMATLALVAMAWLKFFYL